MRFVWLLNGPGALNQVLLNLLRTVSKLNPEDLKKLNLFTLIAPLLFSTLLCTENVFSQSDDYYSGELWVQVLPEVASTIQTDKRTVELSSFTAIVGREDANYFGLYKVRKPFYFAQKAEISEVYHLLFTEEGAEEEFARKLELLPGIAYAERVPIVRPTLMPDDLGPESGGGNQYGLWRINAQDAWDITTGNTDVRVAIVDDAVLVTHPDLIPNLVPGYDVASDDDDPMPNDPGMTHGTHVAGIVGAATDNGVGVASIGFNIKIIPVKSSNSPTTISDAYSGVVWAADNGADVINMSWGGGGISETAQNIINYAHERGCVNIAASGNDNVSDIFYPAGYDNVISVSSTTSNDSKSGFSNYGAWVDVSAPGTAIRSTYHSNYQPNYNAISGTSMASPMVAGLAGLVLSINPEFTQQQVEDCILNSADNIDDANGNFIGQLGSGRINAYEAVLCAQAAVNAPPIVNITADNPVICPGSQVRFFGSSTGGLATEYQWTFPGGNPETSTAQNPEVVFSETGFYDITVSLSNDFGEDIQTFNAFVEVSSNGTDVFFEEDFESGDLSTAGWSITPAEGEVTWEIAEVGGAAEGSQAAGINLFNHPVTGARDGLISPPISLEGHTNIELNFRHAHRRRNPSLRDSLIVYVSTDGGATFPDRIFANAENGQGSFATGTLFNQNFIPTNSSDWCFGGEVGPGCLSLDLSNYDGEPDVRIKFETYNVGGNNIYIDDVRLSGNCIPPDAPPIVSLTADAFGVCTNAPVQFTDQSLNVPTSYNWLFEGGTPATSDVASPEVVYETPGVYAVSLTVTNEFGSDAIVLEQYITATDAPVITVESDTDEICLGESVTLTASGPENLTWSPLNGLSSATGFVVEASPISTVTYVVSGNDAGCSNEAEIEITVLPTPPNPEIISGNDITFTILEPAAESGWFEFAEAGNNWSIPDLSSLHVEAELALAVDGSAGDSLLCGPALADLQGKIAVIYRGSCQFGIKALNAQNAGAVGVVIVNNTDGPIIEVDGGTDGSSVTIPVVMVSLQDGARISNAINAGTVSAVLGQFRGGSALCPDQIARVAGPAGFSDYIWSNGGTDGVIQIVDEGAYTLTFDNGFCSSSSETIEIEEVQPEQPVIEYNGTSLFVVNVSGTNWQWYLNGDPIEGATVAGIIVSDLTGVFTVEMIDNNGCSLASDPFELVLSTSDAERKREMNIFPVPARVEVNIDLPVTMGESLLNIYSADGRTIEQRRINTSESRIITVQTGSWAPGAYIVQLISGADVQTGRIVKVD